MWLSSCWLEKTLLDSPSILMALKVAYATALSYPGAYCLAILQLKLQIQISPR
jgi:hypothetical protein